MLPGRVYTVFGNSSHVPRRSVWGESGLGVSCENFARFLESCAQLERGLLYLWPQIHRHTDIVAFEGSIKTYPGVALRTPLRTSTLKRCIFTQTHNTWGLMDPS